MFQPHSIGCTRLASRAGQILCFPPNRTPSLLIAATVAAAAHDQFEPTWSDLSHHLHPSIIRISFGSCCIRACVSAYLGSFLHAGCPVASSTEAGPGCTSSTPPLVDHAARINMPVVDNTPSSSQSSNLGTDRQMSSIPIAASELPKHQQGGSDVWMYPSEQQFYNAMKRKVCCKKTSLCLSLPCFYICTLLSSSSLLPELVISLSAALRQVEYRPLRQYSIQLVALRSVTKAASSAIA